MVLYHLLNSILPGHLGTRLRFYKKLGYPLSLRSPKTFSEKVHWRKAYDRNPLFTTCADKLAVRDYVRNKIGEQYLIPLLYVGDSIDARQLADLDGEFVVKTNHRSGGVFLVGSSMPNDLEDIEKNVKKFLARPYAVKNEEWWYEGIERQVLVERLLRDSKGKLPDDYKFYVFNREGASEVVLMMGYDRHTDLTFTFYDENLEPAQSQEIGNVVVQPFDKPENYELMVYLAKKLAADFDFCRVDFYNVEGRVYFGELTFAPFSGTKKYPYEFDLWMGEKWQLPVLQESTGGPQGA